jgi:PAS domain S-box-containing protein
MDSVSDHIQKRIVAIASIILAVSSFFILGAYIVSNHQQSLNLTFNNPYVFLSMFTVIANIILFILVRRSKVHGSVDMWFSLFLLGSITWSVFSMISRFSTDLKTYEFWAGLTSIGVILTAPLFLMFVLAYTRNTQILNRWTTMAFLLFSSCLIAFVNGSGNLLWTLHDMEQVRRAWGYGYQPGEFYLILVVYLETILLTGVVILVRHYRRLENEIERKQTKLIIIGATVPIIAAAGGDLLLPIIGVIITPTSVPALTIECILITYAIIRYRLFDYDQLAVGNVMVESVAEGLAYIDNQDRVIQINHAGAKLLGLRAEQIIGKDWRDYAKLYHGANKQAVPARWRPEGQSQLKTVEITNDQNFFMGRTHKKAFPVAMTITHLSGDQGAGTVIAFKDVTHDKEASDAIQEAVALRTHQLSTTQSQLLASINSLRQGFIVANENGQTILSNDTAQSMFKLKQNDVNIARIADLIGYDVIDIKKTATNVITKGKAVSLPNVPYNENVLSIYVSPIKMQNSIIGATLLIEDVTEARIMERSKDEFFSIASHELRTPLTAIRGNTKMIDEYYSKAIKDTDVVDMIHDIHESSVRLIEIVNDFLDVSRLEQGKTLYRLEVFHVEKIVESIIYELSSVANARGITLTADKKLLASIQPVYADINKTKQVLYNLVGNSLKFTEKGSITIGAKIIKKHITITITDTGRGISPESQKLLFHKFQQANASLLTRDTTKGTGLGLYICKLLLTGMQGKIALEKSVEGKGSTFSFTLPLATKQQIASGNKPADQS